MKENLKEPPIAPCASQINIGCNFWPPSTSWDSGYWGFYPSSSTTIGWGLNEMTPGFGLLYQWSAAMNNDTNERAKGVCPDGWHIPSDCEFKYLEHGLGMPTSTQNQNGWRGGSSISLKISTQTSNGKGTNSSGFTFLLSGTRSTDGVFTTIQTGFIYSSTTHPSSRGAAYSRGINIVAAGIARNITSKFTAASVRCLKN
jgi:uncharacterized protein (TIGR02145 family)